MSSRARVFAAYRKMFRARKQLFAADKVALRESRVAIKSEFVKNATADTSGSHFEGLLGMVDEAVEFMKHGIMQGQQNPQTGNFAVKVKPDHTAGFDHAKAEPITPEVVSRMEKDLEQPNIEITKGGGESKEK